MEAKYWKACFLCIMAIMPSCVAYSSSSLPVEIPISFDQAKVPILDLMLDKHQVKFYLDTGARGLHLPKAIADSIPGLQLTGRTVKSIDLAGKAREDAEFRIPELHMNGMVFVNVTGQYLSEWGVGQSEFQLPVIGLDVLQQKETVIDFPGNRLLMSDDPIAFETLYPSAQGLEFSRADEGVVVSAQIGEHAWPFVLDSGASISIIKASARIDDGLMTPCSIPLPDGRCEAVSGNIDIGNEKIALQLIRMPLPEQFKPMGVIGYDLFGRCAVYSSKDHRKMSVSCKKMD